MTAFTLERVDSYRTAENLCPGARTAELASFRGHLQIGAGKTVLELGSGNGTLTRCLRELGWTVDTVDIAFEAPPGARRHYRADISKGLGFLPKDATYDAVVSLAVLHHVVACPGRLPDNLANDIAALTRPGAVLILQDVPAREVLAHSAPLAGAGLYAAMTTARIFADLVDPYSVPTHNGVYLHMAAVGDQLADRFAPVDRFYHRCDWHFPDRKLAARYVQALFNLNLGQDAILAALEPVLQPAGSGLRLPWALDCLVMRRL
ncbi:MAG: class I SAM-dependent methyltransferase [Alphaproteobacteria bacterium]|nr:class I SAM-dependent methyltransferase [Alphaproteobacteria bacterium]